MMRLLLALALLLPFVAQAAYVATGPKSNQTTCNTSPGCVTSTTTSAASRTCIIPSGEESGDLLIGFVTQAQADAETKTFNTPSGWTEIDQYSPGTAFPVVMRGGLWYQISDGDTPDAVWTYDDNSGADDNGTMRCLVFVIKGNSGTQLDVTWDDSHRVQELNGGQGPGNPWNHAGAATVTPSTPSALSVIVQYLAINGDSRDAPAGWNHAVEIDSTSRGANVAWRQMYTTDPIDPGPWLHVGQTVGADAVSWHLVVRSAGINPGYRRRQR